MLRDGSLASRRLRPSLRAPPGSRAGNPGNVCVCVFFTFGPYFEIACPFVSHCCFCVLFVYFKKTPQVVSLSPLEGNFLLIVPHSATDSCHMCSVSQASLCRQMTIQGLTHTHAYIYIYVYLSGACSSPESLLSWKSSWPGSALFAQMHFLTSSWKFQTTCLVFGQGSPFQDHVPAP